MTQESKDLPPYWELLSEEDKAGYLNLKAGFSSNLNRRSKNSKFDNFEGILETIKIYAERGDGDDWRRCLVCGICWMDQSIAINTRQLRKLILKCKSSINGSLQKLGYATDTSHSESWKTLFPHIPILKDHFSELRKWTVRYLKSPEGLPPRETQKIQPISSNIHSVPPPATQISDQLDSNTWPLKFRTKAKRLTTQEPILL